MRPRPAGRQVPHDAVRDLEHARHLVERGGLAAERQQVVDALRLVVDLVREAAAAPRVVGLPGASVLLDELARAREDLLVPVLRHVGVEHEQDLVVVQRSGVSFPWTQAAPPLCAVPRAEPAQGVARSCGWRL